MCSSSGAAPPISQQPPAKEEQSPQKRTSVGGSSFWVRLTVPSRVKTINPSVKKLMKMLKSACLAPAQAFAIETALREALANAIVHGNRADPAKNVRICCGCDDYGIRIVIADEGDGFDPGTLASPLASGNLDSDHGRGVFLIHALMDEVRFENGGRTIHMRKKQPTPP